MLCHFMVVKMGETEEGGWCRCNLGLCIVFNEGVFLVDCHSYAKK